MYTHDIPEHIRRQSPTYKETETYKRTDDTQTQIPTETYPQLEYTGHVSPAQTR